MNPSSYTSNQGIFNLTPFVSSALLRCFKQPPNTFGGGWGSQNRAVFPLTRMRLAHEGKFWVPNVGSLLKTVQLIEPCWQREARPLRNTWVLSVGQQYPNPTSMRWEDRGRQCSNDDYENLHQEICSISNLLWKFCFEREWREVYRKAEWGPYHQITLKKWWSRWQIHC